MMIVNDSTSCDDFDVPITGTFYVPRLGYSVAYEHTRRQMMCLGMACRGWTDNQIAEYMAQHYPPQPQPRQPIEA